MVLVYLRNVCRNVFELLTFSQDADTEAVRMKLPDLFFCHQTDGSVGTDDGLKRLVTHNSRHFHTSYSFSIS
jgi:hypothetical protein